MNLQLFPVQALNQNITNILKKIITADILRNIKKGLNNQIRFIDQNSHISNVAEINKNIDGSCTVSLSAAFCQYLWLICDIAIKDFDIQTVIKSCKEYNITTENFKVYSKCILDIPKGKVKKQISSEYPNMDVEQYLDYLYRIIDLVESNIIEQQQNELEILSELIDKSKKIDFDKLKKINLKGKYEEKTNSVYCYGIAFILLHELAHFALGHMDKKLEDIDDETNADMAAFWNMYSDIPEAAKFSANCGILCALFSLLYLNPNIEEDGIHPREDKRIFEVYDTIKCDNDKYTYLLTYMFDYWGNTYNIPNYPKSSSDIEKHLDNIRGFLQSYMSVTK